MARASKPGVATKAVTDLFTATECNAFDTAHDDVIDDYASQTETGYTQTIPAPKQYDYVIVKSGATHYAINGLTNVADYSGAAAATVINSVLDAVGGGSYIRTVAVVGDIEIAAALTISSHTTLAILGTITLANGSDCNMIENKTPGTYDEHITITGGGVLNGDKATQSAGHGIDIEWSSAPALAVSALIDINNISVLNCFNDSINIDLGGHGGYVHMDRVIAELSNDRGLYTTGVCDALYTQSHFGGSGSYGLYIQSGGISMFNNCYFPAPTVILQEVLDQFNNCLFDGDAASVIVNIAGSRWLRFTGCAFHAFGNDGNNTINAVELTTSTKHSTNNIFSGCYFGRARYAAVENNLWDKGIEEADANQDFNLYVGCNGVDCGTALVELEGANSKADAANNIGTVVAP